jgi:hypothetical protein
VDSVPIMNKATGDPRMIMVIKMLKARVTVMLLSGISQPRWPSASCHLVASYFAYLVGHGLEMGSMVSLRHERKTTADAKWW